MKNTEEISDYLKMYFGEEVIAMCCGDTGQPWLMLQPSSLLSIAKFLRDDTELRFNTLMCLSGIHYPDDDELGVAYHLHSTSLGHSIAVKVRVPVSMPDIPSVESIWKTADWHEREAMDMVGVIFDGHPNLKRILTPDDWEGHPLRKDYVQQEYYQDVSTRD